MDAATLLPILGGGAKGLKIVKGVKAALPTIIKAASVYGLGAGVHIPDDEIFHFNIQNCFWTEIHSS